MGKKKGVNLEYEEIFQEIDYVIYLVSISIILIHILLRFSTFVSVAKGFPL